MTSASDSAPSRPRTIRATIMQTPSPDSLDVLADHVVTIGSDGVITSVEPAGPTSEVDLTLPPTTVLLPGMIDTHIHAPQWPQLGTGLDLPLDQWLFTHTFPLEARFADTEFAVRVWDSMVPGLLAHGTTTAVYYGSIHADATVALAQACVAHGQRAFVGRVAMDHPDGTPDFYRDASAAKGVRASAESIEMIEALPGAGSRVRPIITPRFIPACTDELLTGLGELADATGQLVQTHCSENDWEHHYVLDRHGCSDTDSLANFGLAREHTVMAHATHLSAADRATLIGLGAGVAHCPLSNVYFSDAVFSARASIDDGLRVGLGTDIAGGPQASLIAQCGHAVSVSRLLEDGTDAEVPLATRGRPGERIDIIAAFWMATGGGADLLGIPAGLIAPGQVFDAIAVDTDRIGLWPEVDDTSRTFEKVVRGAGPATITSVWVDGVRVAPVT